MNRINRRKVLVLGGTGSVMALAGCMGIGTDDEDDGDGSEVEEGADGPGVGEREVDDDDANGENGENGDDDTGGSSDDGSGEEYEGDIFTPMNQIDLTFQGTTVVVSHEGGDAVPNAGEIVVEWGSYADRQREEGIPTPFAEGDSFEVELTNPEEAAGTQLVVQWHYEGEIGGLHSERVPESVGQ